MAIIQTNLNRFTIFTARLFDKLAVKWILTNPPLLAYIATLTTLWNSSVRKVINDKLQGSVATYLRMGGGVVNNQIKKGLLLSLSVKKS